jgi:hypothetical protein
MEINTLKSTFLQELLTEDTKKALLGILKHGQIKHPEDVLALSLTLTRAEEMAPLYADVLKLG